MEAYGLNATAKNWILGHVVDSVSFRYGSLHK